MKSPNNIAMKNATAFSIKSTGHVIEGLSSQVLPCLIFKRARRTAILLMLACAFSLSCVYSALADCTDVIGGKPPTCAYVSPRSAIPVEPKAFSAIPACRLITNNCAEEIMVPIGSQGEWSSGTSPNGPGFLQSSLVNGGCVKATPCPGLNITMNTPIPSSITQGSSTRLSWTITGAIGPVTCYPSSSDGTWTSPVSISSNGSAIVTPNPSGPLPATTTYQMINCSDNIVSGISSNPAQVKVNPGTTTGGGGGPQYDCHYKYKSANLQRCAGNPQICKNFPDPAANNGAINGTAYRNSSYLYGNSGDVWVSDSNPPKGSGGYGPGTFNGGMLGGDVAALVETDDTGYICWEGSWQSYDCVESTLSQGCFQGDGISLPQN